MFYFQTGLLTAQSQLLLCCLPSFSVSEKLAFWKLLRAPSRPLLSPVFPQWTLSLPLWSHWLAMVSEFPEAFRAPPSVRRVQEARLPEGWEEAEPSGRCPSWEVGCHLSVQG